MRNLLYLCLICLLSGSLHLPVWANGHSKAPLTTLTPEGEPMVKPALLCNRHLPADANLSQVKQSRSDDWQLVNNGHLKQAFSTQPIWCQLMVKLKSNENWLLGFADPHINDIQIYFSGSETNKITSGSQFPFKQRPIDHRYFYFAIPKFINSEQLIYFRLQSLSLNAPVQLITDVELSNITADKQSLSSMSFGFLFPLLISFFATRQINPDEKRSLRFWSAGIALSYTATSTAIQGWGFQYMWPNAMLWNSIVSIIFAAKGLAILWLYLDSFHGKLSRAWNVFFFSAIFTTLIFALAYLVLRAAIFYHLGLAFIVLNAVTILSRHLFFLIQSPSNTEGKIWVFWMLLVGFTLCQSFGILHLHLNVELMMALNFSILVIILGGDIYRQVQQNQMKLIQVLEDQVTKEQQIAHLHHERNTALEAQVAERTKEIDRMMRELHLSNVRLRTASHTDALTGILNRYAVEAYIEEQWARCLENNFDFGIAFVDADHFKAINDTYGHDAGDACLKHLAQFITHGLEQVDMRVARYGGEEFIIIAPDINTTSLKAMMERLRQQLEDSIVHHQSQSIKLTVSIGVASQLVTDELHSREIIKQADTALYHAKNSGRNRVVSYQDITRIPPK